MMNNNMGKLLASGCFGFVIRPAEPGKHDTVRGLNLYLIVMMSEDIKGRGMGYKPG
jgi:hypothetical protein